MTDKQARKEWDELVKNIQKLQAISFESPEEKAKRIDALSKDWIAHAKYYFPNFASAEFAWFHKKAAKAIINADQNEDNALYAVLALAREHGKTALMMFIIFYLYTTKRAYVVLAVSNSWDAAVDLMMPLILNLESNQRIINDFGEQTTIGSWEDGHWVTKGGLSIRCIGAGQSPRGTRNEEKRPDLIVIDDIDTDKESRNQTIINKKWDWIEQALFPSMSITETKRFIFLGNIISKDGCIMKAWAKADFRIKVNILDEHGQPSWKERYNLKQVNYMISKISYASAQKEYFNNPINEGTVFKDIHWGAIPPLHKFPFLVAYGDPSYKHSKKNDFKSVPLLGMLDGNLYIIKARLKQTTIGEMIEWYYEYDDFVNGKVTLYNYVECGGLQDTFFQELFTPQLIKVGNAKGRQLSIAADNRKKPDKFTRIEAGLEPLNRTGRMIFNEKERDNPHMLRLVDQFKILEPSLPGHDDGPDATEGGWWIINNKLAVFKITAKGSKRSPKRF